jgi:hypothetical protein
MYGGVTGKAGDSLPMSIWDGARECAGSWQGRHPRGWGFLSGAVAGSELPRFRLSLDRDPVPQESDIQVCTPKRGRTQRITAKYANGSAITTTQSGIHLPGRKKAGDGDINNSD